MPQTIYFNGKKYNSMAEMPPDQREMYERFSRFMEDADKDGVPDVIQSGGLSGLKETFGMIKDIAQMSSNTQGMTQEQFSIIRETDNSIVINGKQYESIAEMPPDIRQVYNEVVSKAQESDHDIFDEAWREVERDEFFKPHDDEDLNRQFRRSSSSYQVPIETVDSNGRLVLILAIGVILIAGLAFFWFFLF